MVFGVFTRFSDTLLGAGLACHAAKATGLTRVAKLGTRRKGLRTLTSTTGRSNVKLSEWFNIPKSLGNIDDAQLAAQHVLLQKQLRTLRLVLTCTVLLLIAVFLIASKKRIDAIPGDEVTAALEKRADVIATKLGDAAGEVRDEVAPVLSDEIGKEAASALEDMQKKIDTEMQALETSVTQKFRLAYQRELDVAGAEGSKMLQDTFPQLKGDEKKTDALIANFQESVQMWAQKQLVTTFKKHIDTMFRIKTTLNRLVRQGGPKVVADEAAGKVTGEGAASPAAKVQPERLLEMWIELVSDALGGTEEDGDLLEKDGKAPQPGPDDFKPVDTKVVPIAQPGQAPAEPAKAEAEKNAPPAAK